MNRTRDLVQRTRTGRIRSSEISDPTITVSSLRERGVEALYGIIYPPQVAIVGFGKVVARPWVVDGAIGPRSVITITLSGDHRVRWTQAHCSWLRSCFCRNRIMSDIDIRKCCREAQ
jgi:pyruvate dehydrogenase E2 component (dihydrolipoamide acetyltransferase)